MANVGKRKKSKPMKMNKKNKDNKQKKKDDELDMNKLRHEVFKFGLKGFDNKTHKEARIELAIKLGAKPKGWARPESAK